MTEEEQKDILFDIDMQLYDEFNDKFCEINNNLGNYYSYKDLEDLEKAEKEKEIKLLREAVRKQQEIIKNQSYTNKKDKVIEELKNKLEEHITFCEQEAKGHINNNVCHISLRFAKSLLEIIKKVGGEDE